MHKLPVPMPVFQLKPNHLVRDTYHSGMNSEVQQLSLEFPQFSSHPWDPVHVAAVQRGEYITIGDLLNAIDRHFQWVSGTMPTENSQRIQNSLHLEEVEDLVAFRRVNAVGRVTMFDGLHRTLEAGRIALFLRVRYLIFGECYFILTEDAEQLSSPCRRPTHFFSTTGGYNAGHPTVVNTWSLAESRII
jgi:hypothetical protein